MSNDTHNDGGPAFPVPAFTPGNDFHDAAAQAGFACTKQKGMSLRDFFASSALQAWIEGSALIDGKPMSNSDEHAEAVARTAYAFADAMLAQRERQGGGE